MQLQSFDNLLSSDVDRVGLVAGWGSFPVEVAERCRDEGRKVFVAALKGHADPMLEKLADGFRWYGVLKLGGHMKYFSQQNVKHVALAGKLFKDRILYHGRGWIDHFPDATCFRLLGSSFLTRTKDARDDTLMSAVVNEYLRRGMEVLPITKIAPQLLAQTGTLTRRSPTRAQLLDIQFGWEIARQMGGLDIGQSITVKDQLVLGVEAIEGTDALIERTGKLCPRGGFSLIKVAKPQQDMRFDVPTIGLRTIQKLAAAGGKAIGIEAAKTILVDREETLQAANKLGISIYSAELTESESASRLGFDEKNCRSFPKAA